MKDLLKRFWNEEEGMGTIEIVVIIAVLLAVALLFKDGILQFTNNMMNRFFDADAAKNDFDNKTIPPANING